MRPSRLFVIALAAVAALALLPSFSPAAEDGGVLSMAAARNEARSLAWDVARRNLSVNSVKLGQCQRRAADRIFCNAIDRGSTSAYKTTCSVWVRVTLVGERPKASLISVNCENERLPVLRAFQALEATRAVAAEQVGDVVSVGTFGRVSRTEIMTTVVWIRPAAADPTLKEPCALNLRVSLTPSEEVAVQITESFCIP